MIKAQYLIISLHGSDSIIEEVDKFLISIYQYEWMKTMETCVLTPVSDTISIMQLAFKIRQLMNKIIEWCNM